MIQLKYTEKHTKRVRHRLMTHPPLFVDSILLSPYVKGVKRGLDYFSTTLLVFLLPSVMVFTTMLMPRCNLLT